MHILTVHCEDYKISFELLLLCCQNKLTILVCMEMKGNIKFTMEESDKIYLSQMSRLAQIVLSHIGSMYLWHNVMRMALNSGFTSKNKQPLSYCKKNIRYTSVKKHIRKYLTSTPQNCKNHQNKIRLRTCHIQE